MRIVNQTRNTVLADSVVIADRFLKRIKGLLDRTAFKKGESLVIRNCNSVHTFFMAFAIDVLFLDKRNRVVKVIPGLVPFRATWLYWRAAYVIELPAGMIKDTDTREGDVIAIA